jgi:sarcosine oxidase
MSDRYDVIVAGLGAMGSATLYHLARKGARVAGFDRFAPPHTLGSTHGKSRIIREAYYEHPLYVPLVQRAYELWAQLEREWGQPLYRRTGGLMLGPRDGVLLAGARRSAREHRIAHEELSAAEVRARFPGMDVPPDFSGLLELRAGVLDPEGCVAAHLTLAARAGARAMPNEPVLRWTTSGGGVSVETATGRYDAARLVVSAGAWAPELVPGLPVPLQVERQVMLWFQPSGDASLFEPERCPVAMIEYAPDRIFYSLPDLGDGLKAAIHHEGETTTPESVRREVGERDITPVRALLQRFMPGANGPLRSCAVCLYTNTPDTHFAVGPHPLHEEILVVSPCSGHGFKFASAIGEAVAELALEGKSGFDLGPFGLDPSVRKDRDQD